jgi:predicted nucleic acid-binding protein
MPRYFFDSSALVKNYHAEAGTATVQSILSRASSEFLISRLATVEMLSAFAMKVRTGVFSASDFGVLRRRFLADIRRKSLVPVRVLSLHFEIAGDLVTKHAMSRQLRALDALQLAVALNLHRSFPVDHFVCSDQKLCDVAGLEGLSVIKP